MALQKLLFAGWRFFIKISTEKLTTCYQYLAVISSETVWFQRYIQKQAPAVFSKKILFLKISQYYIKACVLESPFNKNAGPQESLFDRVTSPPACNFMKKRLQHRCFPVKFTKFLRAPILKSICERLTASIYWFQILIVDSTHFSSSYISILPENLRKDLVFSRFQRV